MQKKLLAVLLASMFAGQVLAEDKTITITAQDMPSALHSLASQTGIQLLFTADELKSIQAKGISGSMSAEEALKRLLQGTNYTFRSSGAGAYVLHRIGSSTLREVVVTATKSERALDEVPVAMSVIGAKEIEQRAQVYDLSDILLGQAGMDATRNTPAGPASMSIRGLGSGRSLILIDGQPADLASYSGVGPLQIIDPSNVERVEIVRGAASALYGSRAMSGVVNIITKRGKGDGKSRVTVGYDSMRSPAATLSTNGAKGDLDYNFSYKHYKTQGYNIFSGHELSFFQTAQKTDWNYDTLGMKFGYQVQPGTEIRLGLNYADSAQHMHGFDNQGRFKQHFDTLDVSHQVNDVYRVLANLSYRKHNAHYISGYTATSSTTDEMTDKTRVDIQNQFDLSDANRFILGLDYGIESVDWSSTSTPGVLDSTARSKNGNTGIYVQEELKPTEALFLTLGGRYDKFSYSDARYVSYASVPALVATGNGSDSAFNPRLGAKLKVAEATSLRASAGTGYRAPTPSEKYQQYSFSIPNPDLKSERSKSYDVGVDHKFDNGLNVAASLYYIQLADGITMYRLPGGKFQYNNVSRSVSKGLELELNQTFNENWSANFNYTNGNTRITEQVNDPALVGNQMPRAPHLKANIGIVYDQPKQFTFRADGRYTGSMFIDAQNTQSGKLGGYFLADVKGTWHVSGGRDGLDVSVGVSNLFDRTYFRFAQYWYEPGRVASVEAAYKW